MDTTTKKAAPAKKPPFHIKQANHSTDKAAAKLLGAILIKPSLALWLPIKIQEQLSPYGLFLVKAAVDGWGIEGIRHALDSFGLAGDEIVKGCLRAVRGNPENAFCSAARQLCEVET